MSQPTWRSLLFAPADNSARCAKACTVGADAVILDLEDAVAPAAKPVARAQVVEAAQALKQANVAAVVRINSAWRDVAADLEASVCAHVDAIMVPKVESAARLVVLSEMLTEFELAAGLTAGRIGILALIESPAALACLQEIARCERVIGLALGTEDFCLSLGVAPKPAALDLPSRLLSLAAAERSLMALAVPLSIAEFRDVEAYAAAARHGACYGVNGAICIHPAQVKIVNECFGASEAERAEAERIWAAWQQAQSQGQAVTTLDGRMIDLPVAERARRVLQR